MRDSHPGDSESGSVEGLPYGCVRSVGRVDYSCLRAVVVDVDHLFEKVMHVAVPPKSWENAEVADARVASGPRRDVEPGCRPVWQLSYSPGIPLSWQ